MSYSFFFQTYNFFIITQKLYNFLLNLKHFKQHSSACLSGIANTESMMQSDIPKSFGIQQSLAFKNHEPSSQSQYAIHRDSNRCMMSHFI